MLEDIKPKAEEAAKKVKEPAVPKTGSWSRRTQMGGGGSSVFIPI